MEQTYYLKRSIQMIATSSEDPAPMKAFAMPCNSNYTFSINDSLLKSNGVFWDKIWNHIFSQNTPIWKQQADYFGIFLTLKTNAEQS